LIVEGGEQEKVAFALPGHCFERLLREGGVSGGLIEQCGAESARAEREDGVHVVPESPFAERIIRVSAATAKAIAEGIEEWVEIVIADDECTFGGKLLIVVVECFDELQADGRFAGPFFAEDNSGTGVTAVTEDFIPGGMVDGFGAVLLEDVIRLGIFLTEGIEPYTVVFEELLELHVVASSVKEPGQQIAELRKSPGLPAFSMIALREEYCVRMLHGGRFSQKQCVQRGFLLIC